MKPDRLDFILRKNVRALQRKKKERTLMFNVQEAVTNF